MIKYAKIKKSNKRYNLIREPRVSIQEFYRYLDKSNYEGVLITSLDSNEKETKEICSRELTSRSISFEIISYFCWLKISDFNILIEDGSFGTNQESCFFLKRKPYVKITRVNLWERLVQNYLTRLLNNYLNADSDLYITNEFNPETNIFSSDEKLINDLLHNFNNNK